MKRVVVGMSGGVDSAVSALLLKRSGYEVIALFMKNWEEVDASGVCTSARDYEDVVRVSELLQIPHYLVHFVDEYRDLVFAEFIKGYEAGITPNPDILCNREIKFKAFLEKAEALGADLLATGHYCQLDPEGRLLRGADPNKDQSYFLHAVKQKALQKVLFPVGHLPKKEVRRLAEEAHLPVAEKKDSTGICFIGKRDFRPFLAKYIEGKPGNFETLSGEVVGRHEGLSFYTLGQRKGMGLGGEGEAWYVVGKDKTRNVVLVERGGDHPALFSTELIAKEVTWVAEPPSHFPFRCTAKVRYRQEDQPCTVETIEGGLRVLFDTPQRAVTPGQSVVFYQGPLCLGGGVIQP